MSIAISLKLKSERRNLRVGILGSAKILGVERAAHALRLATFLRTSEFRASEMRELISGPLTANAQSSRTEPPNSFSQILQKPQ